MNIFDDINEDQEKIIRVLQYISKEWGNEFLTDSLINKVSICVWKNKHNYEGNIVAKVMN